MITNLKMKQLIEEAEKSEKSDKLQLITNDLINLFSPDIKQVYDCIIVSKKNVKELEANFQTALNMYSDKTEFEASNTDTRINAYFDNDMSEKAAILIGLTVIDIWSLKIKKIDEYSQYCFIITSCDGDVEIRFHKIRDDETGWLDAELESYEEAVGYVVL